LNLAFPNREHAPAVFPELAGYPFVSHHVAVNLGVPKLNVRLRTFGGATIPVTMPETTVNENHGAKARKNYVRLSGKFPGVKAKPVALGMEKPTYGKFRCRPACSHPPHELASPARIEDVCHVDSHNSAQSGLEAPPAPMVANVNVATRHNASVAYPPIGADKPAWRRQWAESWPVDAQNAHSVKVWGEMGQPELRDF
jgi:hypothetical protein